VSWIDIPAGEVWMIGESGDPTPITVGSPVGAALPAVDGWLVAAGVDVFALTADGMRTPLGTFDHDGTRFNDGGCDRAGRAFFGTMDLRMASPVGELMRWESGRSHTVRGGLIISNGVAWSPDGATMYLADTVERLLWTADYDSATGECDRWRAWDLQSFPGKPDGICVDATGAVWVALWDGGALARLSAEGEVEGLLTVPGRKVSSCCFGGDALDRLYVTTAETASGRADGVVLEFDARVTGLPDTLWPPG
jgi:sugar lactone lactonase YvrE